MMPRTTVEGQIHFFQLRMACLQELGDGAKPVALFDFEIERARGECQAERGAWRATASHENKRWRLARGKPPSNRTPSIRRTYQWTFASGTFWNRKKVEVNP